jgi:hypothetical protein
VRAHALQGAQAGSIRVVLCRVGTGPKREVVARLGLADDGTVIFDTDEWTGIPEALPFSGPAEILTKDIGQQTARIMHRIAGTEEPPEPQSDEALAALDRVKLAITVERVSAVTHM